MERRQGESRQLYYKRKGQRFCQASQEQRQQQSQTGAGSQVSQCDAGVTGSITAESGLKCSSCEEEGDLLQHLSASSQCRLAYRSVSAGREKWPFNVLFFIGPESDHWECLSVTDSLTHSLTHSLTDSVTFSKLD